MSFQATADINYTLTVSIIKNVQLNSEEASFNDTITTDGLNHHNECQIFSNFRTGFRSKTSFICISPDREAHNTTSDIQGKVMDFLFNDTLNTFYLWLYMALESKTAAATT